MPISARIQHVCRVSHRQLDPHACRVPSPADDQHLSNSKTCQASAPEDCPNLMADSGVAARHYKAAVNQECLLLWQISQLDYVCGNVHIDLSELIELSTTHIASLVLMDRQPSRMLWLMKLVSPCIMIADLLCNNPITTMITHCQPMLGTYYCDPNLSVSMQ